MSTEIYSRTRGRSFASYDLADEAQEKYGLGRHEAHEAVHALLEDIISIDGEDAVILDRRPVAPELLTHNPNDLNVDHWLTITDAAAEDIREALAATYQDTDPDD
ncbi:hypothetical protein [Streptomyces sp. NRRL F-5630]|uniref:hypothetical protein n=1 Tax=Streptomyces sp. NRRL F-5630 TaxID=1463864 RepID=UPI003EBCCA27